MSLLHTSKWRVTSGEAFFTFVLEQLCVNFSRKIKIHFNKWNGICPSSSPTVEYVHSLVACPQIQCLHLVTEKDIAASAAIMLLAPYIILRFDEGEKKKSFYNQLCSMYLFLPMVLNNFTVSMVQTFLFNWHYVTAFKNVLVKAKVFCVTASDGYY